MYIFYILGNNYIRGENMKYRRIKPFFMPVIYGACVVAFLFTMYFVQRFANNIMFSKNDDIKYVDGEILEDDFNNIPVINTSINIIRPYTDSSVSIAKTFYDYQGEADEQENSILYYDNTYIQNSGVDYSSSNVFDVVSILDGTVISVTNNDLLGTVVEIRHSNDLISVYQSLSELFVKVDDHVSQGQIIAKSGVSNVNKDLGNHLHFELYYKGEIVNPEEFYNKSVEEF